MLNQLLSEDKSFKDIISNISLMKEKIDYLEEMINFRLGRFEEEINIAIEDPMIAWNNVFLSKNKEKLVPLALLGLQRYRNEISYGIVDNKNGLVFCYWVLAISYLEAEKYNVAMTMLIVSLLISMLRCRN